MEHSYWSIKGGHMTEKCDLCNLDMTWSFRTEKRRKRCCLLGGNDVVYVVPQVEMTLFTSFSGWK